MNEVKEEQKEKAFVRQSIRFKIFFVSLLPTIALLAAAFLNNQYLNVLGDSAEQILSKNYKSIRASQEVRKGLEEIRNLALEKVSKQNSLILTPQKILENISFNIKVCKENVTEIGERELIEKILESYHLYEDLVYSLNQNISELMPDDHFSGFLALTAKMIIFIDELVSINEDAMEHAEKHTRILASQAQRNAAILFGIIIVIILVLSYFLSYRIAMPIMKLVHKLSKVQEGKGVYPRISLETNDEIGLLANSFNHLFSRLEQYDNYRNDIIAAEREKVRRSEEAKGKFIADISHQLKTPMTSLSMSIGMLHSRGETMASEKRIKLFSTASDDCVRLAALINELVDISRLETMALPRPKETLDIGMVINECLIPLNKQAENKGISIVIDIPVDLPQLTIDSFRFPWVITNLVGNALRYTSRGGEIMVKVFKQGARFYFQCSDTGEGIDPKFLPHIFNRFTQFSERGKSGTVGLGLAIVKDIIEQHGGDIKVQSEIGKGTTFIFWIPFLKENKDAKSPDH
ncbi:MAG: HAMP domain-containing sensor histidine kinase [Desulfobacula sp.]|jgi:signal transduction histidine kinase|nr:HAMP domain-containing sensor histidine kinase [Desulfobacula sp.]